MDEFYDSPLRRLKDYIQRNRRWMFIFEYLGYLLALGAIAICFGVTLHFIEGNFLWIGLVILLLNIFPNMIVFGKAYNNKGDRMKRVKPNRPAVLSGNRRAR